ncbi:MAG: cyclohexanecarboxyl-CoA dehydrogenase [Ilumatobacteraceae bacterium]
MDHRSDPVRQRRIYDGLSALLSFAFSDEQEQFRGVLDTFARKALAPGYIDRAASSTYPMEVHRQLGDLGVLGVGFPEKYGGTGVEDPVMLGLATETLAYGDVNMAAAPVQLGLSASQLLNGSEAIQEHYLSRIIAGDITCGIALTEPQAGSDAAGLRTVATPDGSGWRLTGEKTAITWACNAAAMLIYARAPGTTKSTGISCFVVPLPSEGTTVTPIAGMGCLPLGWGSIHLDDVFVPRDALVGEEGRGFSSALAHFGFSRAALGLLCLGAAQASLDEAAAYATQREAFGQPIANYQGVSFSLAEHTTFVEAARWLCYRSLWQRDASLPHNTTAAMSKWWAPVVALDAIQASMRIHGNLGYATALPLQQRHRDVMAYLVADGTSEIQKHIIAKDILSRATQR